MTIDFNQSFKFNENEEIDYDEELDNDDDDSNDDISHVNGDDNLDIEETDALETDSNMDLGEDLDEKSRFTYVIDENGERKKVLKSSLLWSLTESNVKMSNDRTKRFRYNPQKRKAIDI